MSLYYPAFATLAEFRQRIGVVDSNVASDAVFAQFLSEVSADFEQYVGRPLRRQRRTEILRGGDAFARLAMWPVVKIHSVRESDTGDFETAGAYTELAEFTDWVRPTIGAGYARGDGGWLQRIGGDWPTGATQVQVVYTAGYLTEQERAAANTETELRPLAGYDDFVISRRWDSVADPSNADPSYYEDDNAGLDGALDPDEELGIGGEIYDTGPPQINGYRRGFIVFDLKDVVPLDSTIHVLQLELSVALANAGGPGSYPYKVVLLADDPRAVSKAAAWALLDATDAPTFSSSTSNPSFTRPAFQFAQKFSLADAALAIATATLRKGFVAFGVKQSTEAVPGSLPFNYLRVRSVEDTDTSRRPSLTMRRRLASEFLQHRVPNDLRLACLLQAAAEYQSRSTPMFTAEAARGVTIASGTSYVREPHALLPRVQTILDTYAQVI